MASVEGMTPQKIRGELSFAVRAHVEELKDQVVVGEREKAEVASQKAAEYSAVAVTAAISVAQYVGRGFPQGVVEAPVGSIYTDMDATGGAIRWIKTAGNDANGWSIEYGETERLNISDRTDTLAFPEGYQGMWVSRSGNVVTLECTGEMVETSNVMTTDLPYGFRPEASYASHLGSALTWGESEDVVRTIGNAMVLEALNFNLPVESGWGVSMTITYLTADDWPAPA